MMRSPGTASPVVRFVARRAIPLIQLFALYVLGHGEDGPGGGFQAGVIFAAAFVLATLVGGWHTGRREISEKASDLLLPGGAMLYAAIGFLCMLLGGAYLGYEALVPGHPLKGHHLGIIGIEIGVTLTVAGAMATLLLEMGRPKRCLDPDDEACDGAPESPKEER